LPRQRPATTIDTAPFRRPTEHLSAPRRRASIRRVALGMAAIVALAAAGLLGWRLLGHRPEPSSRSFVEPTPPRAIAAPAPPAVLAPVSEPVQASSVKLVIRGMRGALVTVDGKSAGRVPVSVELPARAGTRAIVVRKSGYTPLSSVIAADRDAELT